MLDVVHGCGHGALGHRDEAFSPFPRARRPGTPDHTDYRMSILGKMSVAMRVIVTIPMSTIRMAATVNVYGRLRARRTSTRRFVSAPFAWQGFLWPRRCRDRGSGVDGFSKRLPRVLQPRGHDPCTQLQ